MGLRDEAMKPVYFFIEMYSRLPQNGLVTLVTSERTWIYRS